MDYNLGPEGQIRKVLKIAKEADSPLVKPVRS